VTAHAPPTITNRVCRGHANYSAADAARFAGVPAAQWRSWEDDRARPSSAHLRCIADVLGWPFENLVAAADGEQGCATPEPADFCLCGSTTFKRARVPVGEGYDDSDDRVAVLACDRCAQLWVDDGSRMLWVSNVAWVDEGDVGACRRAVLDWIRASDVDAWCLTDASKAVDVLRH
jgi:hypothetical protein